MESDHVLDLPPSWVERLSIDRAAFLQRYACTYVCMYVYALVCRYVKETDGNRETKESHLYIHTRTHTQIGQEKL
jgi:hypothetical protein